LRGGYYHDTLRTIKQRLSFYPGTDSKWFARGAATIVMQKKTATSTITVPVPNHKEIKLGKLESIIRESQVFSVEFEA